MKEFTRCVERRDFLKSSGLISMGLGISSMLISSATDQSRDGLYIIGPKDGYTPQVGTLLSTMTMMREWVLDTVKDLTVEQLDFLLDEQANSIGAMLLHLAATERYYQLNTFQEMKWGSWDDSIKEEWDIPMGLGVEARNKIKGNNIEYYLSKLDEVRTITKQEFAKRDDSWLQKSELFFGNQPTNNHCKWFHVCEHESNHNGQMKFISKRLPS